MNPIKWHFREMSRPEMNQDIELGEMFGEEAVNEPLSVRLVREVIQNSLDASIVKKVKGGERTVEAPVRIRFSLEGLSNPLATSKTHRYFSGLQEHLKCVEGLDDRVRDKVDANQLLEQDVPFILIEDSGTTGLRGDPGLSRDPEPEATESEDFYWFFRNIGRSGKGATENGSWGLGKWVFPDASGASAFFALTTTDKDTLLMGQSVLSEHYFDGTKFAPHGYWSIREDDRFAIPLCLSNPEQKSIVEDFISDFRLTERDKTGLSVVIPFPRVDQDAENPSYCINTKALAKAVIQNYFYPIVLGYLDVRISDEPGEMPAEITKSTIDDMVDVVDETGSGQWTKPSYRRVFQMLRETKQLRTSDYKVLNSPPTAKDDYEYAKYLLDLENKYYDGYLLPFKIQTTVRPKNGIETETELNVYLKREPDLENGHDYFVRGTLSIPHMDYIQNYKALALIVVDEKEPLAEMLRDSEPPAHTIWRPQAKLVRDRWVAPQRRINAVRDAVKNILWHLEGQQSGLQKDAFLDLFELNDTNNANAANDSGESGSGTTGPSNPPNRNGKPSPFIVSPTKGGVSIRASTQSDELPERIVVRAAYDVPRGDPFKKFNEYDFAFAGGSGLRINLVGGEIVENDQARPIGANAIRLKVKDHNKFSFKITGFDPFRDVVIKIDPEENA